MSSTTRKVHYLCPFCQKVVHGELTLSTDIAILKPRATSAAVCPDCKVEMIDADALNIPQLQLLHKNNYMTTASCDRYHDGFVDPDYDYSKEPDEWDHGWHNGPFVGVYDIGKKRLKILKEVIKEFNAEHKGVYKAECDVWEDDDDEEVDNVNITVNGKEPGAAAAIEANRLLLEVISRWIAEMKKRNIIRLRNPDFVPEDYSVLRDMPDMK